MNKIIHSLYYNVLARKIKISKMYYDSFYDYLGAVIKLSGDISIQEYFDSLQDD